VVRRILVAVDGSKESNKAVRMAASIAKILGAELTLIHVVEMDEFPILIAEAGTKEREEMGQLVLGGSAKIAQLEGVAPKVVLRRGHPTDQILRFARSYKPQLIVTGSRGLTGARGVLMGSVSMGISRKAKCSVAIVR